MFCIKLILKLSINVNFHELWLNVKLLWVGFFFFWKWHLSNFGTKLFKCEHHICAKSDLTCDLLGCLFICLCFICCYLILQLFCSISPHFLSPPFPPKLKGKCFSFNGGNLCATEIPSSTLLCGIWQTRGLELHAGSFINLNDNNNLKVITPPRKSV